MPTEAAFATTHNPKTTTTTVARTRLRVVVMLPRAHTTEHY